MERFSRFYTEERKNKISIKKDSPLTDVLSPFCFTWLFLSDVFAIHTQVPRWHEKGIRQRSAVNIFCPYSRLLHSQLGLLLWSVAGDSLIFQTNACKLVRQQKGHDTEKFIFSVTAHGRWNVFHIFHWRNTSLKHNTTHNITDEQREFWCSLFWRSWLNGRHMWCTPFGLSWRNHIGFS